jgi:predicted ATP-binding protein involved in virulence
MEKNRNFAYDVEGIVLIDEIETHLHVELQKNILPILTTFFPNIQFIVTSHSPFVLQSIDNAVIYDLENRILVEDLTSYSWEAIVENYFDVDQYSTIVKQKMQRYEELKQKKSLIDTEIEELKALENSLLSIGSNLSPELATHVKQLMVKYGRANV